MVEGKGMFSAEVTPIGCWQANMNDGATRYFSIGSDFVELPNGGLFPLLSG